MKNFITKWFSYLLIVCLLLTNLPSAYAAPGSDINGHWAEKPMQSFIDDGYVVGFAPGEYRPNMTMTRAQFATVINRFLGFTKESMAINQFMDVHADDWFYHEMAKALEVGYMTGTSSDTISPKMEISREQACVMLVRLLKIDQSDDTSALDIFTDQADVSPYARSSMIALKTKGYLFGDNGRLFPHRALTRAEAVSLLYRMKDILISAQSSNKTQEKSNSYIINEKPNNHHSNTYTSGGSIPSKPAKPDITAPDAPKVNKAENDADHTVVTGNTEPHATIIIKNEAGEKLGEVTADQGGNFSINITPKQPVDSKLHVTAKDAAGNESTATKVTVTEKSNPDVTAPDTPTVNKAENDADHTVVTGNTEPHATIIIKNEAGEKLGEVTADQDGNFSINITPKQPVDSKLHVTAKDAAGNESTATKVTVTEKEKPNTELVVREHTGPVNMGWAQFVAIHFKDNKPLKDFNIIIDGVDVTEAVTPVTDDTSMVKWEYSNQELKPAKLTVIRNTDGAKEDLTLSKNTNPKPPTVRKNTSAKKFIASGPTSIFELSRTIRDNDGKERIHLEKSTFSWETKENPSSIIYLSPDAEIAENGQGEVKIYFAYDNDEHKAWFNNVANEGALKLLEYDESKNILNDNLTYHKQNDVTYENKTCGEIVIGIPQTNFTANKRYYVSVASKNHETVLVPIRVVKSKQPTMYVVANGPIHSGDNLRFMIRDFHSGMLSSEDHSVTLTMPNNERVDLRPATDFRIYTDSLFVDNSTTTENGRNNIPYEGTYTIEVDSPGYKPFSTTFKVIDGKPVSATRSIDAVSRATGGGNSGGSDGGSGSLARRANIVFDGDLLINAYILHENGIRQSFAEKILNRWNNLTVDYVTDEFMNDVYKYDDYYTAVQTADGKGKYLPFIDYKENAKKESYLPAHIHEVLYDGLLGSEQNTYDNKGKPSPTFTLIDQSGHSIEKVLEGEAANIKCSNPDFLKNLKAVKIDGDWKELPKDKYHINHDVLTIAYDVFKKIGDHTVTLESEGYKKGSVPVVYTKKIEEFVIVPQADPTDKDSDVIFEAKKDKDTPLDGPSDFLKNLKEVKLTSPSGKETRILTGNEGGTASNQYYEVDKVNNTIKVTGGNFGAPGLYKVTFTAEHYDNPYEVTFSKTGELLDPPNKAPQSAFKEKSSFDPACYELDWHKENGVSLNGDKRNPVDKWRNKIIKINVNGAEYHKGGFPFKDSEYTMSGSILKIAADGFTQDVNEVVIEAEGYHPLTLKINKDGSLVTKDPDITPNDKKEPPIFDKFPKWEKPFFGELKLIYGENGENQDQIKPYLEAIKEVTVNEVPYSKASSPYFSANQYYVRNGTDMSIDFSNSAFNKAESVLIIKADGYKDLIIDVSENNSKGVIRQ